MIVDMRLRPPLPSWVKKPQFQKVIAYYPSRIGFPRPPSAEAASISMLIDEMNRADVQWGAIMGRKSCEPLGVIPNEEIAECINNYPNRFLGWAGIDLSQPVEEWLKDIRHYMKLHDFKGISLEPAVARSASMRADDRCLYPIYEECNRLRVPVSITLSAVLQMVAGRPYEYSSPLQIYQVARDFPKLQIHVAHAAWPWVMEMIGVAFVCPNVWVSPDQYMVKNIPGAEEFVKAANNYFQDRTLFGTAYPSRPHLEMVQAYYEWGWAEGVRQKVMYENALRLMNMA
jgi:predicted TIM-barrel fold metal-dependent hydrolase